MLRALSQFSVAFATAASSPGGFSDGARTRSRQISTTSSSETYFRTSSASSDDMRHTLTMRERFVDSDGVRIHVVEQGAEDGEPVVFVHGFPEFWWSWRHQMKA